MKQINDPHRLREFAARLNAVLDTAYVPRKGAGRQAAVARVMGVSVRGARRWIEGDAYPQPDKFLELAARYGTTVDWLLGGHGETPTGSTAATHPAARRGYIPHIAWTAIQAWAETGAIEPAGIYAY